MFISYNAKVESDNIIKMDIKDFQGLTIFKLILPITYICSWICMIIGPIFFEASYVKFCIFIVAYIDIKIIFFALIMLYITIKTKRMLNRAEVGLPITEEGQNQQLDISQQIYYAFILPNFKQEVEMMAETLDLLASHKRAKERYLIFLAMEAHQEGCEAKAEELIGRFKQKFRLIDFTRHEIREFEQKGKASNVSWCVEHLEPVFEKNMIDPEQVFLTILDADSWAPDLYFDIMEEQLIKNYYRRHNIMFQPPQIFCRNNLNVPIITRVQDMMHSYLQCSNLFSLFGFTFPISNYSVSYCLMKKIGFWDTCADAIGEDFHTAQKAFWKTNGDFKTIPIYVPFNQVNISTGNGYVEDVIARFWQAERHAQGCSDLAYTFKMFLKTKFRPINLVVFYQVLQTFIMPTLLPFVFISLVLQSKILYFGQTQPAQIISPMLFPILLNTMSVISTLSYFNYEYYRRRCNKVIYRKQNESIIRILEYPIVFSINMFMILTPAFIIAIFMSLSKNREYIVAEKKNTFNAEETKIDS